MPTITDHHITLDQLGTHGIDRPLLGINDAGRPLIHHRDHHPHLRISGETGQGKSVAVNTIAAHDITHRNPIVHLDPKPGGAGWLTPYAHTATTPHGHQRALRWAVAEMRARQQLCATHQAPDGTIGVPDIHHLPFHTPRLVVVIEEMSAIAGDEAYAPEDDETPKDAAARVEENSRNVVALAKRGRSAGVHLIGITQYPTVEGTFGANRMGGSIHANFGSRLHLDRIAISLRATFDKGDGIPDTVLRTVAAGRKGRGAYTHLDPADDGRVRACQIWWIDPADLADLARTTPPPADNAYATRRPGDFDHPTIQEFTP